MFERSASYGLIWGQAASALDRSHHWVLAVMQKHGPALVTMLWRILGNEDDVCDAYQNTFMQLAHIEGGLKPACSAAYVFRTASNVAITTLRRRAVERKSLEAVARLDESRRKGLQSLADGGAGEEIDVKQLKELLRSCIARLPENLREVIVLRDLGELSYSQVASILSITPATARVYRCKALQLLAVWMKKKRD